MHKEIVMRSINDVTTNLLNLVEDLRYVSEAKAEGKETDEMIQTVATHYSLSLDELKSIEF